MSPRIQELAEQAEMAANKGDHVNVKIMMSKFAELIVRECMDTVIGFRNQFGDSAHDEIKQHFGVES